MESAMALLHAHIELEPAQHFTSSLNLLNIYVRQHESLPFTFAPCRAATRTRRIGGGMQYL